MKNRKDEILKILLRKGEVNVKELSTLFSISEVSIRKDLSDLENAGKLKRIHGGAILIKNKFSCIDLENRKSSFQKEKHNIAEKIFQLIENDTTVFLGSSTINIITAKLLAFSDKKVRIITNMLEILNILYRHPSIELFVLSGFFSKTSGGFISVDSKIEFQKLNIDKAFVGCSGIDINKGWLSTHSMVEGEFKKIAIEHSKESYIILESNKFDTYDLCNFISIEKISNIISNLEEADNRRLLLEELGIKVI